MTGETPYVRVVEPCLECREAGPDLCLEGQRLRRCSACWEPVFGYNTGFVTKTYTRDAWNIIKESKQR